MHNFVCMYNYQTNNYFFINLLYFVVKKIILEMMDWGVSKKIIFQAIKKSVSG